MTTLLRRCAAGCVTLGARALRRAGSVLVPHTCCLCGAVEAGMTLDLCDVCRDQLPALPAELPGPPGTAGSGAAVWPAVAGFDLVCTPFAYGYPVDHFIRALKFDGERAYARVLGVLLAEARLALATARPAADSLLPELVVPVPLHLARFRMRGFNQAHEIARFAARRLQRPVAAHALQRTVATAEQSGLGLDDRRINVHGAFRVHRLPAVRHVALVDDVVTTGSTVAEAAAVLRRAGVERLELWSAARAQRIAYSSTTPANTTRPT